jgi:hypothetical protein
MGSKPDQSPPSPPPEHLFATMTSTFGASTPTMAFERRDTIAVVRETAQQVETWRPETLQMRGLSRTLLDKSNHPSLPAVRCSANASRSRSARATAASGPNCHYQRTWCGALGGARYHYQVTQTAIGADFSSKFGDRSES